MNVNQIREAVQFGIQTKQLPFYDSKKVSETVSQIPDLIIEGCQSFPDRVDMCQFLETAIVFHEGYLLEASEQDKNKEASEQLARTIIGSSIPVAISSIIAAYGREGGAKVVRKAMIDVKKFSIERYNSLLRVPVIGRLMKRFVNKPVQKAFKGVSKFAKELDKRLDPDRVQVTVKNPNNVMKKFLIGGASVSILIGAGHVIYQRYLSQAAKKCKGMSGEERTVCILNSKVHAIDEEIRALQHSMIGCKEKKDPKKCEYALQQEIWSLTKRKQRYQHKTARIQVRRTARNSVK